MSTSLEETQESFKKIVGSVDEDVKKEMLSWIRQAYLVRTCSGQGPAIAHSKLRKIGVDIKENENLPISGVLPSETITIPDTYKDPEHIIFADLFLREAYELEELCKQGKLDKYFCKDCNSRNIVPLNVLTKSLSRGKIDVVFSYLLPPLNGKVVVNLGSRLGGWLYGAYLYTPASKIISIEENPDLCEIQRKIIAKHNMSSRTEVINSKIADAMETIRKGDVVILQDVKRSFPDITELWKFLKTAQLRSGSLLVTPNCFVSDDKVAADLSSWLKLKTDLKTSGFLSGQDSREPDNISVYEVV